MEKFLLSQEQTAVFMECKGHPERTTYNLPLLGKLPKDVDPERLKQAILLLIKAHPILGMVLSTDENDHVYLSPNPNKISIPVCSMSDAAFARHKKNLVRPFSLDGGPLARFEIYETPSGTWFFEDIHHILHDGFSAGILSRDLRDAYQNGTLTPEEITLADVAREEAEYLASPAAEEARKVWAEYLKDYEGGSLPERDVWEDEPRQAWLTTEFSLEEEAFHALRSNAGCSTAAFFSEVMAETLSVYSGVNDILFNTIYGKREDRYKNTVGLQTHNLLFRRKLSGQEHTRERLKQAQEQLELAHQNAGYPFLKLIEQHDLKPEVVFIYQKDITSVRLIDDLCVEVERIYDPLHIESQPISVEILSKGEGRYQLHLGYLANHYSGDWAEVFSRTYIQIAGEMLKEKNRSEMCLISETDLAHLNEWNQTETPVPDSDIVTVFRKNASNYPENLCVASEDRRYTYQEVDELSDRIAARLAEMGVSRGDVVSILIPRNEYMIIAPLGVMKAAAAYQPLDTSYPPERLQYMMQDASVSVMIADRSLMDKVPDYAGQVLYTEDIPGLADAEPPKDGPRPEDLYILLYTSGSTGVPKGVMLEHRNILAFNAWDVGYEGITPESRFAAYASFGFDAFMLDMYPAILNGADVFVIPESIRLDLEAMDQFINENQITHITMTTQVGRQFAEISTSPCLRHINTGGEALVPVDMTGKTATLHNLYGPTECTILATGFKVKELMHRLPIGYPVDLVKLYTVDALGRRVPPLAPGELWIAGPHVSRGYLNKPDKTAEVFISNPFDPVPHYERAYRTGDIVRVLPDGAYDFLGRNDGMVKIRGFRIELSEIESVIRNYPGIKNATVQVFRDAANLPYIAAYVVSDKTVDTLALDDFIRERKPPYMVPSVTMQIPEIPMNQNQKVDKKALPLPKREAGERRMPRTEAEKQVYDSLAEIVGHSSFGVDTNMFDAGLTSIGSMRLNVLLSRIFKLSIRTTEFRDHPTVEAMAKHLEERSASEEQKNMSAASTAGARVICPLSREQQGILVDCLAHPESTAYNISTVMDIPEGTDPVRFKEALAATIKAHPGLSMRLITDSEGTILAENRIEEPEISETDEASLMTDYGTLIRPYKLMQERLYRAILVHEPNKLRLFLDVHHICFDGESLNIFMEDLSRAYAGEEVEPEDFTGFDAAIAEQELRNSDRYEQDKTYFTDLLFGREMDCLPVRDIQEECIIAGDYVHELSVDRTKVENWLKASGVTMNALWNAAFGFALAKFLGRDDCVYNTVYHGRNDSRLYRSVGMFVHTIPVVADIPGDLSTVEYVQKMGKQLQDSMDHDAYSFSEISRELGCPSDVLIVYEGSIGQGTSLGGKRANITLYPTGSLKTPLTIYISDSENGFSTHCEYDGSRYESWSISALINAMEQALLRLTEEETLSDISLLTEEGAKEIDQWNATETDVPYTDLITLFRSAAKQYPENTAVIFRDKKLTYREVDDITDRIAVKLSKDGIGRGDVVSCLIPRGEMMVLASIGVMKTGAAYQPLDPSYPTERLMLMMRDSEAKLLIAEESLLSTVPENQLPVMLTKEIADLRDISPEELPEGPTHEDLMILLYTSGSTGTPKGVMLSQGNLANFVLWYHRYYGLTPENVVAAYASYGFDACMMDMYSPLTKGAAVCIVPEDMRMDLFLLNDYFRENGVTHSFITTQMARLYASEVGQSPLKYLSAGGEKLVPIAPPDGYSLINVYGPTECTIFSTITPVEKLHYRVPIGKPLDNYKLYVVDKYGKQLPVGAIGELLIAGRGVGMGYRNLPEKTAAAFIPNPFNQEKDYARAYRTGDQVRRMADGCIDFIGRNDGQVKIRGFRIELSEVETVIREFPGIKDVTVQAFEEPGGGKYIAAYVVSPDPVDVKALNEFIKERKPPYMVPAFTMQLERIPLNQNQKVLKSALPRQEVAIQQEEYIAPTTEREKEICRLYAKILGVERVSATDSFFELGGTSLTAARVVMYAMNHGYPIVYQDVFNHPSARELATLMVETYDKKTDATAEEKTEETATNTEAPASRLVGPDGFDYTKITRFIAKNCSENAPLVKPGTLGNVILAGATGFLGIHVLRSCIEHSEGKIYCLLRAQSPENAVTRLKMSLMYYFGDASYADLVGKRVFCLLGDITEPESLEQLKELDAHVVINCAACVKHFSSDDLLERVNYHGVENLISLCSETGMRLVHISTASVAGEMKDGDKIRILEKELYIGQGMDNEYVRTKFLAERALLTAVVEKKLDACVIRVGNLMSRFRDGEFQMNFTTNSFMSTLRAFYVLEKFPFSSLQQPAEFSPIDCTADAVVTLAAAKNGFSVYHAFNNHLVTMGDVIYAMKNYGFHIDIVSDEEFAKTLSAAAAEEEKSQDVLPLVAYDNKTNIREVGANSTATMNALFSCEFKWPMIDDEYLLKSIEALDMLMFFS